MAPSLNIYKREVGPDNNDPELDYAELEAETTTLGTVNFNHKKLLQRGKLRTTTTEAFEGRENFHFLYFYRIHYNQ
jgi:hypothetical protein